MWERERCEGARCIRDSGKHGGARVTLIDRDDPCLLRGGGVDKHNSKRPIVQARSHREQLIAIASRAAAAAVLASARRRRRRRRSGDRGSNDCGVGLKGACELLEGKVLLAHAVLLPHTVTRVIARHVKHRRQREHVGSRRVGAAVAGAGAVWRLLPAVSLAVAAGSCAVCEHSKGLGGRGL